MPMGRESYFPTVIHGQWPLLPCHSGAAGPHHTIAIIIMIAVTFHAHSGWWPLRSFFLFFFFIVFIFIFHFNKSAGVVLLLLVHNLHSSSSMQHAIMMMMMFEEWKVRSSVGRGLLYFRSGEKYLDVNPHDIRRCAGTPCIVKNWQLRRDSRASSSFLVVFLVWFVGAITVLLRDWETSVGGSAIFLWPFLRVSLLLVHFSN